MKLGAFVMTYHRAEILGSTLETILGQTIAPECILVVDNGSTESTRSVVEQFNSRDVVYQAMTDNLGPAGASAFGLRWFVKQGYDWIYWGDDDDPPNAPDVFQQLISLISHSREGNLAAVGRSGRRWNWQKGEPERIPDSALHGPIDVDLIAGNQQLFVSRTAVEQVGVPCQELFFGYEELEYCLRLRRAGLRLVVHGEMLKEGRIRNGRLNIKSTRAILPQHGYKSLWRRYYSTRNYIYMMRNTFDRPDLARREFWKACGRTTFSLGRGVPYAVQFANMQLRGVVDGYRCRMGRTILPG